MKYVCTFRTDNNSVSFRTWATSVGFNHDTKFTLWIWWHLEIRKSRKTQENIKLSNILITILPVYSGRIHPEDWLNYERTNARIYERMNERTSERRNARLYERMNERTSERTNAIYERINERTKRANERRARERTKERTEGRRDEGKEARGHEGTKAPTKRRKDKGTKRRTNDRTNDRTYERAHVRTFELNE